MTTLQCPVKDLCGGCDWGHLEYSTQIENKKQNLLGLLKSNNLNFDEKNLEVLCLRSTGLRSRFDFALDHEGVGLYQKNTFPKKIVHIQDCPQLDPNLRAWFQEFTQKFKIPLNKGSLRLRTSSDGKLKGAWFDLANEDIKKLLDEKNLLQSMMSIAQVEMGQKRKRVVDTPEGLKLKELPPEKWFVTKYKDAEVPLNSWISSFTQPSLEMNLKIGEHIRSMLKPFQFKNGFEFGCGLGNLSFPILSECEHLTVTEIDEPALLAFSMTLQQMNLKNKVTLLCGDYQKDRELNLSEFDFIFVNPPRSGLKHLAKTISASNVEHLFYMSCFPETFIEDLKEISKGKQCNIKNISIIDQFTQTHHYEILCHIEFSQN